MAPVSSFLLALGAFAGLSAAWYPVEQSKYINNTIVTFTNHRCYGNGFVFKNIDSNVCALTLTGVNETIPEAIKNNHTLVQSAQFFYNESGQTTTPVFVGWTPGPDSNSDGPLQCGTNATETEIHKDVTCVSAPQDGSFTGFSYYREDKAPCKEQLDPFGVLISGKVYAFAEMLLEHKAMLLELVLSGKIDIEVSTLR